MTYAAALATLKAPRFGDPDAIAARDLVVAVEDAAPGAGWGSGGGGEGGAALRRYPLQEWLRLHLDTLPDRQAERDAVRAGLQVRARRALPLRGRRPRKDAEPPRRKFSPPRQWGAGLTLAPEDTERSRSTAQKNQRRAKERT